MKVEVKDLQGQVVGELELADAVFAVPMNTAVVHQVMVAQQANRRQGTHATKGRGEVSGGGRKPWPQKYTGRARQGSIRAPQWRHGGVVHGPRPRSHRQDIPKRMRRLAIRCLLSDKAREGYITVVDSLDLPQPRTKALLQALEALGLAGKRCLIATPNGRDNTVMAARNIPRVKTLPARLLNCLDLLNYDHLLISVEGVRQVEELWAQERPRRKVALPAGAPDQQGG